MTMTVSDEQWRAARGALKAAGDRFADLVARVPQPDRSMATADWSVAVTTAHVGSIAWLYRSLLDTGAAPRSVPDLDERIRSTTVDTVDALNEVTLRHYPERDARRSAERLRTDVDHLLRVVEQRDPSERFDWLGGAQVPLAGLFAHLVNELLIHGFDVARAIGLRWDVPSRDAGLFFDLLLVGVARNGYGRLLDGGGSPRERRIAIEFRSRYTMPVTFVLQSGLVTAEEPGGPVDVRVTFDPAVLNLMLFGRVSRLRAALTGKVVVRGRRPWLLSPFLRTVRVPDTARTQPLAPRT